MFLILFIDIGHCFECELLSRILKGNGRAFCSGGDVVRLYNSLNEGELHLNMLLTNKISYFFTFNLLSVDRYNNFMQISFYI